MLNRMMLFSGMVKKSYILRGVRTELRRSQKYFLANDDKKAKAWLVGLAVVLMTAALSLYAFGGYHAGFFIINYAAAYLLPTNAWQIITFVGDAGLALCLFLFMARRNPATLWVASIATVTGAILTRSVKSYFDALRPPAILSEDQFILIGEGFKHNSFPSGHSLTVFVLVSVLFYFSKGRGIRAALIVLGSIVALSRVVVGVHWPIDVLVGGSLGIAVTIVSIYLAKRWSWGFTVAAHSVFVGFLLVCVGYLFVYNGGYPEARGFAKIVATSALLFFVHDYLLISYSQIRLRRKRMRRTACGGVN